MVNATTFDIYPPNCDVGKQKPVLFLLPAILACVSLPGEIIRSVFTYLYTRNEIDITRVTSEHIHTPFNSESASGCPEAFPQWKHFSGAHTDRNFVKRRPDNPIRTGHSRGYCSRTQAPWTSCRVPFQTLFVAPPGSCFEGEGDASAGFGEGRSFSARTHGWGGVRWGECIAASAGSKSSPGALPLFCCCCFYCFFVVRHFVSLLIGREW